ncbi:uncharacterized protein LOC123193559 [Mangifera indica]|uniref:uncharacterized protein LOC123193559 n=1 Tax=Mangifera indica TaxID=29780 RepID=UPI001CFB8CAE|nr:uncharacterized protein LOC123193559 [Mangifera indica]
MLKEKTDEIISSKLMAEISASASRIHFFPHKFLSEMIRGILVVLLIGTLAWAYQTTIPPPPRICGSPSGPAITGPRLKLKDGRHLAYKEYGLPKHLAKHKIIFFHGFSSCRHDVVIAENLSKETVDELGIYIVSFNRAGYGESDPNTKRTIKSLAMDTEEFADQLGLGTKFYVVGHSMGGQTAWSCLKYIPHRLAGAALIAPVINYWWSGFPRNLSAEAYYLQLPQDFAHYAPWLIYWWNTQKLFPASAVVARNPQIFSTQDKQLISKLSGKQTYKSQVLQQGAFESNHRDMIIGFGNWEFSPMDLQNPFPEGHGSVHLWHGDDDRLVPVILQRYIAKRLPWIHYHELPGAGHLFPFLDGMSESILKALLLTNKVTST